MTFQSLTENNHPQIWIQEMKIVDCLMISPTIRISQEILCLPYAGFFSLPIFSIFLKKFLKVIFYAKKKLSSISIKGSKA